MNSHHAKAYHACGFDGSAELLVESDGGFSPSSPPRFFFTRFIVKNDSSSLLSKACSTYFSVSQKNLKKLKKFLDRDKSTY